MNKYTVVLYCEADRAFTVRGGPLSAHHVKGRDYGEAIEVAKELRAKEFGPPNGAGITDVLSCVMNGWSEVVSCD
jgi:hypothetical protein